MRSDAHPGLLQPDPAVRLPPVLSALAFTVLAGVMVSAYAADSIWPPGCVSEGVDTSCPSFRPFWLLLGAVWGSLAGTIATLIILRARRQKVTLRSEVPASLLLPSAIGVCALGAAWMWSAADPGRVDRFWMVETGLRLAYMTASPLLFALAFLHRPPTQNRKDRWSRILAVPAGLLGFVVSYLFARTVVVAPLFD